MNWITPTLLFVTALMAVFVEAKGIPFRAWIGAQIDFLPALLVFAAVTQHFLVICGLSLAGGLWFDSLSFNPLGTSVLPLLAIAGTIYFTRPLLLNRNTHAQFILGLAASAVVPLLALLVLFGMGESPALDIGFAWRWLVMALGGAASTPLFFKFFTRIDRALAYPVANETSFRPDREIKRGRF
jgi:hypothetical protein